MMLKSPLASELEAMHCSKLQEQVWRVLRCSTRPAWTTDVFARDVALPGAAGKERPKYPCTKTTVQRYESSRLASLKSLQRASHAAVSAPQSFPLTPEEYMMQLDAVSEYLNAWGCQDR